MEESLGIRKLLTSIVLGSIAFSNNPIYKSSIQKNYLNKSYEVRLQTQDNSGGLDVGKAD